MQQALIDDGVDTYTGERDELDRYYTPEDLVWSAMARLPCWRRSTPLTHDPMRVLEPCAGRALSIARVLEQLGHEVTTGDVDPGANVDMHVDATSHPFGEFDVIMTNPPFGVASDVIRNALPRARWVVMLLRLTYLEPCRDRLDVLGRGPQYVLVMPRRSFRRGKGSSTDSVTCAWMCWQGDNHREQTPGAPYARDPHGVIRTALPAEVEADHLDWSGARRRAR